MQLLRREYCHVHMYICTSIETVTYNYVPDSQLESTGAKNVILGASRRASQNAASSKPLEGLRKYFIPERRGKVGWAPVPSFRLQYVCTCTYICTYERVLGAEGLRPRWEYRGGVCMYVQSFKFPYICCGSLVARNGFGRISKIIHNP